MSRLRAQTLEITDFVKAGGLSPVVSALHEKRSSEVNMELPDHRHCNTPPDRAVNTELATRRNQRLLWMKYGNQPWTRKKIRKARHTDSS